METLENKALQLAFESQADVTAENPIEPSGLRPKPERFAQLYASHGNAAKAYRQAFDVSPTTRPGNVRQWAYELVHEPQVAARVRELLAQAAERVVVDRAAMLADLLDIATVDPSELVSIVTDPCAWCWTPEHLAAVLDRGETPDPDAPRQGCERCRGRGLQRAIITDTADMSGPARRLIAGIETKSDGTLKVRLADQLAARRELHALMGWHVNRSESRNLNINATVAAPVSAEDLLAQYKAAQR